MGKKEAEAYLQLESIITELKKGENESAATVALHRNHGAPNLSRSLAKLMFKLWGLKIFVFILVLILGVSGAYWYFADNLLKKETTTFVEQVQELSTLATAEAHIKVIIEEEDNRLFGKEISMDLPGTKRELLVVVPATIIAGVNLSNITSNDITVDEKSKKLEIVLPHAEFIQVPAIEMDKVQTFSDEGFNLAGEAQEEIKAEAQDIGLLQTAEKSSL
jgi:hypothetical protein